MKSSIKILFVKLVLFIIFPINVHAQMYSPSSDFSEQFLYFSETVALSKSIVTAENQDYEDLYKIGFASYNGDPDLASDSGNSFSKLIDSKLCKAAYDQEKNKIYFATNNNNSMELYSVDLKSDEVTREENVKSLLFMPISAFFDKYSHIFPRRKIQAFK